MTAGLLQIRLVSAGFGHILRSMRSRLERVAVTSSGVVGYVTLEILSLMVGYSLVQVAVRYDPSRAAGWDEALTLLPGWSRVAGFWASFQQGSCCTASTSSCSCVTAPCSATGDLSPGRFLWHRLWTRRLSRAHYAGAGSTTYRWKRNTWRLTSRRALSSL
jgi:hypothetical protein